MDAILSKARNIVSNALHAGDHPPEHSPGKLNLVHVTDRLICAAPASPSFRRPPLADTPRHAPPRAVTGLPGSPDGAPVEALAAFLKQRHGPRFIILNMAESTVRARRLCASPGRPGPPRAHASRAPVCACACARAVRLRAFR
jgi:hypothetical protein